jgi:hypothetical protein
MQKLIPVLFLIFCSCGSTNKLQRYYTAEDKTVVELTERIAKSAADKEALNLLPQAYTAVLNQRRDLSAASYPGLATGDKYLAIVKEWSVMQQLYDKISAVPAAAKVVTNLWNPASSIEEAKRKAAREFYNQGLEYLTYDNRNAARSAYDNFKKASDIIPGYENSRQLMQEAFEKATVKVIVRAPNYYNQGWNYWGFQNDWLQQQIISDLNARAYADVRFYSDWDASSRRIRPDRVVDMRFTDLFVGQVYTNRRTIQRSAQIQTGSTKSNPPQPVYTTVRATVYVTERYMASRAMLECRIYDYATGRNILFDNFPGNDNWRVQTATYTGDSRALLAEDWALINNNTPIQTPTRAQVADRLIRQCYNLLLSRINSGVQFGY